MALTREELTVAIMIDRGFKPCDDYRLKDIVYNIKVNECWKYLRMTEDTSETYEGTEFNMCSTYRIYKHKEYLEVSCDKIKWYKLAWRFKEVGRRCLYAD